MAEVEEEKRRAHEKDVRENAGGVCEEPKTQEAEAGASYNVGGADPADEWRAREEQKSRPKEAKEGDTFVRTGEDENQK
ncbi:hypothetical protein NDU88_002572 [Pleurodeles waltl]|uniref:Uncharacterized protein n=1 Tax=Pleurodeles waltl TaxID=8319 RepID=A0AAV7UA48_PLEWA|nr:hypothetical protein NDU88_002572 [Pleurodeles waltl]